MTAEEIETKREIEDYLDGMENLINNLHAKMVLPRTVEPTNEMGRAMRVAIAEYLDGTRDIESMEGRFRLIKKGVY